jgi:hypothetical protein
MIYYSLRKELIIIMVGLYMPTEIDDLTEQIESCLSEWAIKTGIKQSEIMELSAQITDILNDHLYNGRGD